MKGGGENEEQNGESDGGRVKRGGGRDGEQNGGSDGGRVKGGGKNGEQSDGGRDGGREKWDGERAGMKWKRVTTHRDKVTPLYQLSEVSSLRDCVCVCVCVCVCA